MTTIINDFKNTGTYAKQKMLYPEASIFNLMLYDMIEKEKRYGKYTNLGHYFIKDACTIHVNNKESILYSNIGGPKDRYKIENGKITYQTMYADGIYDICLRNCKGIRKISILIESLGVIFEHTRSKEEENNDFQIPLTFKYDENKPVEHVIFEKINLSELEVSYIPLFLFNKKSFQIILNDGENCQADIDFSNVYLNVDSQERFYLKTLNVFFYINGQQIKSFDEKILEDINIFGWLGSFFDI